MPITPWNWLWVITTLVLWRVARSKLRFAEYLPPFVACSAVAAALTWAGVGGAWHVVLFPILPLVLFGSTRVRFHAPLTQLSTAGSISVPNAPTSSTAPARLRPGRRTRAERGPNQLFWSAVAWAPAAVVAIMLIAAGIHEPWVVASVFPVAPFLAAGMWRRFARFTATVGRDVNRLAAVVALEVSLGAAGLAMPEPVPSVIGMLGTRPVSVTTTTLPASVVPIVAEGEAGLHIAVIGSVPQFDGTTEVVAVEGAFVTLTGVVGPSYFALTDSAGHATFAVRPGTYSVVVVPPGNRWSVMSGCSDLLDQFPVAEGEQWTWRVPVVDTNAAAALGSVPECDEPEIPTPGKGF